MTAWLAIGMWIAGGAAGFGHDLLTAFIQHRVVLTVGARHVDVTVQLTFFEDGSEQERTRMDTNRDGQVSLAERERYLKDVETSSAKAVTLWVGDRPFELSALYAPELDLLGNERAGRGHHRLTLHFFATTPRRLTAGAELVVEDRLWPEFPALGAVQAEGKDGCRLEAVLSSDPIHAPARDKEAREFKARILALPVDPSLRPHSPSLLKP